MSGLLVISPHLDDGVLSCGQLLAGAAPAATLATVCTGVPSVVLSAYDRECGFSSSSQAIASRLEEDRRAGLVLGIRQRLELGHLDGQYAPLVMGEVATTLADILSTVLPETIALPMGLGHEDHRIVSDAAHQAITTHEAPFANVLLYEELPYRVVDPVDVEQRRARWTSRRRVPIALASQVLGPLEIKRAAVACYQSQRTPEWETCAFAPERYWHVAPAVGTSA